MKIVIVDFEAGNLRSVAAAVSHLGLSPVVTRSASDIERADRLILPGVGAFRDCRRKLDTFGLTEPLAEFQATGRPFLGICVGAQVLCLDSEEFGTTQGFGWIDAHVRKLSPSKPHLRVPHVGWNDAVRTKASPLFHDIPESALFYYVHSYAIRCNDRTSVLAECNYDSPFVSAFTKNNLYGVQFHPEKSQKHGLKLLSNFLTLT